MNNKFNQWANELKVGSRYQPKLPTPNAHYFNVDVFKKGNQKKYSILDFIKKMLGLAIICSVMASCSTYIRTSEGKVCGVGKGCGGFMPRKYSGKAPKQITKARMVSF